MRRLVLLTMWVPLLALVRSTSWVMLPTALLAAGAMALGQRYSERHPEGVGRWVRVASFVALHVALCGICAGLALGVPYPQAQFAMAAQAITAFDLHQRRSLFNTLFISGALLYVAATFSRTLELGIYLLAFAGLLATFWVTEQEERSAAGDGLRGGGLQPDHGLLRGARQRCPLLG